MEDNVEVYSFGENGVDKWYASNDGVRVKCNEATIEYLWNLWVVNPTAKCADKDSYTIFEVTQPITL